MYQPKIKEEEKNAHSVNILPTGTKQISQTED